MQLPPAFTFISVIVDQVHERNEDMDLLLVVLQTFLSPDKDYVKVVLLSDGDKAVDNITQYFNALVVQLRTKPAPNKVREYFLDCLKEEKVNLICFYLYTTFFYSRIILLSVFQGFAALKRP